MRWMENHAIFQDNQGVENNKKKALTKDEEKQEARVALRLQAIQRFRLIKAGIDTLKDRLEVLTHKERVFATQEHFAVVASNASALSGGSGPQSLRSSLKSTGSKDLDVSGSGDKAEKAEKPKKAPKLKLVPDARAKSSEHLRHRLDDEMLVLRFELAQLLEVKYDFMQQTCTFFDDLQKSEELVGEGELRERAAAPAKETKFADDTARLDSAGASKPGTAASGPSDKFDPLDFSASIARADGGSEDEHDK